MWKICRVDRDPDTDEVTYFEVQAAQRKNGLDRSKARKSGFVGPDDQLVILTPNNEVSEYIVKSR